MEYKGYLTSVDSYMNLQVIYLYIKIIQSLNNNTFRIVTNFIIILFFESFNYSIQQLANTEEYVDGASTGVLGEVLIR